MTGYKIWNITAEQWSFRKTGTLVTHARQAEIGVEVQTPEMLAKVRGYDPRKTILRLYV